MFEEDITDETPKFLSTLDILKMAKGLYHPWWYDDFVAKQKGKDK